MNYFLKFLVLVVCIHQGLYPITTVYNLRIAAPASARQEIYTKVGKTLDSIFLGTYVHQSRKVRNGNAQLLDAGLFDYIYSFKNWYLRCDAAVGRVHENIKLTERETTHTQTDDILFSGGYRQTHDRLNMAYSALFGFPTHKDHSFEYFQLGTGHVALGVQVDGIYTFGCDRSHNVIMAARFLHFFEANTLLPVPTQAPLCIKLGLGNVVDLFLAYHKSIQKKHHFEIGYNPSCAFGVTTKPSLGDAIPTSGVRNTWYTMYRYIFIAKKHPMGFAVGTSYGFDSGNHPLSMKHVASFWAAYGINF